MDTLLNKVFGLVWGKGTVFLLMGFGLGLLVVCRFYPLRRMGTILRQTVGTCFSRKSREQDISPFQAMATALGGTMGVGNIIGVAAALAIGGAGAVFWLWVAGLCGMMLKYGEVFLAVHYRIRDKGAWCGGPMYYIERGLGFKPLAVAFALCCVAASFGMGNMAQTNAAAQSLSTLTDIPMVLIAVCIAALIGVVVMGGMGRIVKVCSALVPFMSLIYLGGAFWILFLNRSEILPALSCIVSDAFGLRAASGAGVAVMWHAMQAGMSKGIFTNEAGLGSASIAHACADEGDPHLQGLWGIFEVFADTLVVCTVTALVILTSGTDYMGAASQVTAQAFSSGLGSVGGVVVNVSVVFFALASVLSWCLYGEKAIGYLCKSDKAVKRYRMCFILLAAVGALVELKTVWLISDILNGAMLFPNILALMMLCPKFIQAFCSEMGYTGRKGSI